MGKRKGQGGRQKEREGERLEFCLVQLGLPTLKYIQCVPKKVTPK